MAMGKSNPAPSLGISAGAKFADSDLLGIPFRIVISEKTLAKNSVEIGSKLT